MGILDTFKKAIGGKAEAKTNGAEQEAPEPAPPAVDQERAEPEPPLAVKPEDVPAEKGSYTVQSGDTLWSIAETAYGDGSKYLKIFEDNTDLREHPDRIIPGQKLLIPDPE